MIRFIIEAIFVAVMIVLLGYFVSLLSAVAVPALTMDLGKGVALIVLLFVIRFGVNFIDGVVATSISNKKDAE